MYSSKGKLHYGPGSRVVVWVSPDLASYYRSLIPKAWDVQPQKYLPHITVIRPKYEKVKNFSAWKKHEGRLIQFDYENIVRFDGTYFYLDAQSEEIGDVREELGLTRFRLTELGAERKCYHITIGNVKHTRKKYDKI